MSAAVLVMLLVNYPFEMMAALTALYILAIPFAIRSYRRNLAADAARASAP